LNVRSRRLPPYLILVSLAVLFSVRASVAQNPVDPNTPSACATAGTPCVTTYHNDNSRDGVNPNETALTVSALQNGNFALLNGGTITVPGLIYAQPLYLSKVAMNSSTSCPGTQNIILVATQSNLLYALTYSYTGGTFTFTQCWKLNFNHGTETAVDFNNVPKDSTGYACNNIVPESGITSTPVVDTSLTPPVVYVVSAHQTPSGGSYTYDYRVHAVRVDTGTQLGTDYSLTTATTGVLSTPLSPAIQNQRPGLALTKAASGNALLYVAFGSYCDVKPYSGYVVGLQFAYSAAQFSPLYTSNWIFDTENGSTLSHGGILDGRVRPGD